MVPYKGDNEKGLFVLFLFEIGIFIKFCRSWKYLWDWKENLGVELGEEYKWIFHCHMALYKRSHDGKKSSFSSTFWTVTNEPSVGRQLTVRWELVEERGSRAQTTGTEKITVKIC